MKAFYRTLPAFFLFVIILSSCNKGDGISQNATPTDTTPVVNTVPPPLLSRLYSIDTTITTSFDTINRAHCYYDNSYRMVKAESYQTDPANGNIIGSFTVRYFYNGTDTLASMSIQDDGYYTNGTLTDTNSDTTSYVFTNGKCIYDSTYGINSLNDAFYTVYEYQYLPGNVVKIFMRGHSQTDPGTINTRTTTLHQTTDGADILHQTDTTRNTYPATLAWSKSENIATYLQNPDPFARLSDPVRIPRLWDDIGLGSTRGSPRKLYITHSWTNDYIDGSTTIHDYSNVAYTYTFRPDGYPSEFRETLTNNNGSVNYTKGVLLYE
jgi:hypothetical protein